MHYKLVYPKPILHRAMGDFKSAVYVFVTCFYFYFCVFEIN